MLINSFAHPLRLWLLLPVLALWLWTLWKQGPSVFKVSTPHSYIGYTRRKDKLWPLAQRILQALILIGLIVLFAQPQYRWQEKEIERYGVDLMIAIDTSGSMAAQDLRGNRLTSAKKMAAEFIRKRSNDRIGLVIFGNNSYTKCPVTLDHDVLLNLLDEVQLRDAGDGTAIGMAIATALNRLRDSDAQSQAIILITDGDNNAGAIAPQEAAQLARDLNIKIYAIGIGSAEGAPVPVTDEQGRKQYAVGPDGRPFLAKMNTRELATIADITRGKFYQAQSTQRLADVFDDINRLEKTKVKSTVQQRSSEQAALLCFALITLLIGYRWLSLGKLRYAS